MVHITKILDAASKRLWIDPLQVLTVFPAIYPTLLPFEKY